MTVDEKLSAILDIIQVDVGGRGLRSDPIENLITATAGDFSAACRLIASRPNSRIAIVTGFTIPTAKPPVGETDGPLGAIYLARALQSMAHQVSIASDDTTVTALKAGVKLCGTDTAVIELPDSVDDDPATYRSEFSQCCGNYDLLIALERVGPAHETRQCYSMRGVEMSHLTRPAHLLFQGSDTPTIGIGDGGNEIGMGKLARSLIARNIPGGDKVACAISTDQLIVAGISNWGAYGLAAGVMCLTHAAFDERLFDVELERRILETMIEAGQLIDGVTGKSAASVDGLPFEEYVTALQKIGDVVGP